MIETSPIIPREPRVMRIPYFLTHSACFMPSQKPKSVHSLQMLSEKFIPSLQDNTTTKCCECPHILVADDDPFQEYYYTTLFRRSFDNIPMEKKDLNFRVFRSGEALLDRFNSIKKCKCGSQMLIITDYEMGLKNLNGVETALNLRKEGHKGPILLRTSESKEDLFKRHPTLENLFDSKMIDCLLDKSNHMKTSKTIQTLLNFVSERPSQ